jgi:hypothetical protein
MADEVLKMTILDEDDNEVESEDLELAPDQEGDAPPGADSVAPRSRTTISVRQSSPQVICREADDTLVAFEAGREILKVTGPPFGSGSGSANINLQTQPTGAEQLIKFELWNSTGGPCKTTVEIPAANPPYRVRLSGSTEPRPFRPVWSWAVLVRRVV